MTKYQKLFSLELLHGYYKDSICREVNVRPTKVTESWMKKSRCALKSQLNQSYFLIPESIDLNNLLSENPGFEFVFECHATNPDFTLFTDFPVDQSGYFAFSNTSIGETGNKLVPKFQKSDTAMTYVALIKIDLKNLINDQEEMTFQVVFQERRVPWKYFFINQSGKNYESLKLDGSNSNLFSGPTTIELPSGGTAQQLSSTINKLPIKEDCNSNLALQGKQSGEDKYEALIASLPCANPSSITMKDEEVFATIYIYL